MNRRRELTLQRVSRIGGITARDRYPQNTREHATNAFTIEEALGTYMAKEDSLYDLRGQDTYIRGDRDSKQNDQEQFARQMKEYRSAADENQLANAKSDLERRAADRINIKKFEEALAKDPSAQYQLSRYHKKRMRRTLIGWMQIVVLVFFCIPTIRKEYTAYWENSILLDGMREHSQPAISAGCGQPSICFLVLFEYPQMQTALAFPQRYERYVQYSFL